MPQLSTLILPVYLDALPTHVKILARGPTIMPHPRRRRNSMVALSAAAARLTLAFGVERQLRRKIGFFKNAPECMKNPMCATLIVPENLMTHSQWILILTVSDKVSVELGRHNSDVQKKRGPIAQQLNAGMQPSIKFYSQDQECAKTANPQTKDRNGL